SISISLSPVSSSDAASSRTSPCSTPPFPFTSFAMRRSLPLSRSALGGLANAELQVRSIEHETRLGHRPAVSGKCWESPKLSTSGPFISFHAPVKGPRQQLRRKRLAGPQYLDRTGP